MSDELMELAKKVGKCLKNRGLSVTTAESCTGGGVAYWLTTIPGSSAWFDRGFITYSNEAKVNLVSVSVQTLENYGAVSEQTAREMAEGALHHSKADIAVGITGIAGPGGGSSTKPVGTVWIAWAAHGKQTIAQVNVYPGDRLAIRQQAIKTALIGLLA
ncbi:MAG: CinA family protein [Gammaproteobacteria bacterium]